MARQTKIDMILEAFQCGDKLTHLKALCFQTVRLAHFVNVLRSRGWNIISDKKVDGQGTKYTEYFLCQLEPRIFESCGKPANLTMNTGVGTVAEAA